MELPPSADAALEHVLIIDDSKRLATSSSVVLTKSVRPARPPAASTTAPTDWHPTFSGPLSVGAFRRAPWQHQVALLLRFRHHANVIACLGLVDLQDASPSGARRYGIVFENAWRLRRILKFGLPAECRVKRRVAWVRELTAGLQHIAAGHPAMPYGSDARFILRYGARLGNLFVDSSGTLKVGLTIDDSEQTSHFLRAALAVFSAPEVRAGSLATEAADVWFIGCTGWLLLGGYDEDAMVVHALAAAAKLEAEARRSPALEADGLRLELPWGAEGCSGPGGESVEELVHVLRQCVSVDPAARPGFDTILRAALSCESTPASTIF